jgi:hypothetical protein
VWDYISTATPSSHFFPDHPLGLIESSSPESGTAPRGIAFAKTICLGVMLIKDCVGGPSATGRARTREFTDTTLGIIGPEVIRL